MFNSATSVTFFVTGGAIKGRTETMDYTGSSGWGVLQVND
jgi:hypothetical protein